MSTLRINPSAASQAKWLVSCMGKHWHIYSPNVDTGDFVVVINAGKVGITGKKADQKQYFHHTGNIGGERWITFRALIAKNPTAPSKKRIWGMLRTAASATR